MKVYCRNCEFNNMEIRNKNYTHRTSGCSILNYSSSRYTFLNENCDCKYYLRKWWKIWISG